MDDRAEEFFHTLSLHYPELHLQIMREFRGDELQIATAKRVIRERIAEIPPQVAEFILITYLRNYGTECLQKFDGVDRTVPQIRELIQNLRSRPDKRATLLMILNSTP